MAAVHKQQMFSPDSWKSVDFLTDRNGLRKILRWTQHASGRDFRIDTQLVGEKTVVLNRCEYSTIQYMKGNSYGFNFEKVTTVPMSPATQHAEGHHRIVTYVGLSPLLLHGCQLENFPRNLVVSSWWFNLRLTAACLNHRTARLLMMMNSSMPWLVLDFRTKELQHPDPPKISLA